MEWIYVDRRQERVDKGYTAVQVFNGQNSSCCSILSSNSYLYLYFIIQKTHKLLQAHFFFSHDIL